MPARLKIVVAAVLALLMVSGCGPTKDAAPASAPAALAQADTAGPRALLMRWHQALVSGDKAQYLACFVGSEDELVLALAGLEAVQAAYAFHNAIVSTYGADAWRAFQTSDGAQIGLFPRDTQWTRRVTVIRQGDIAFGYLPRGRVPIHMSQVDGVWRIHAGSLVPPGFEARRAADFQFRWAAALRNLIPRVGQRQLAMERAGEEANKDLAARIKPEDRPAAAAAVNESFLLTP